MTNQEIIKQIESELQDDIIAAYRAYFSKQHSIRVKEGIKAAKERKAKLAESEVFKND